ncbi:MAG: nucleoside triphosphate pyrophosphohydrolase [Dehalococcoidales bacterium]|nr:nucleoside triphosphate pyrophosphohydrolase [Dehalococcoidales bacterium]
MPFSRDLNKFNTLVEIIALLRAPNGCPWDREQTHKSLRKNLLEECYEVLEALDESASDKLCDELGDLLMQIIFHVQIADEAGDFGLKDVLNSINNKLIRRHPHIFGSKEVNSAEQVAFDWQKLKQEERGADSSILASVPKYMPALGYSQDIQQRVAQIGFDWEDTDGVIDKLVEEINEFKQADSQEHKAQEFGDLLFTLANIARRMDIDPEVALREANQRFYQRFTYMEELCRQRGLNLSKMSFEEQNALWEEAKEKFRE